MKLGAIIINLERQPERRRHAFAECKRCHLEPDFLDATDALSLTPEWILENATTETLANLENALCPWMNSYALACADSHRRALAKALSDPGEGPWLILEDDFFWLSACAEVRKKIELVAESGSDVVLLGYSPRKPFCLDTSGSIELGDGFNILPYEQVQRTSGAYAYMVTRRAAEQLLASQAAGIDREADDFTREAARQKGHLRICVAFPPLVHHGLFKSTIWPTKARPTLKDWVTIVCSALARRSVSFRRLYAWGLSRRLSKQYVADTTDGV